MAPGRYEVAPRCCCALRIRSSIEAGSGGTPARHAHTQEPVEQRRRQLQGRRSPLGGLALDLAAQDLEFRERDAWPTMVKGRAVIHAALVRPKGAIRGSLCSRGVAWRTPGVVARRGVVSLTCAESIAL